MVTIIDGLNSVRVDFSLVGLIDSFSVKGLRYEEVHRHMRAKSNGHPGIGMVRNGYRIFRIPRSTHRRLPRRFSLFGPGIH